MNVKVNEYVCQLFYVCLLITVSRTQFFFFFFSSRRRHTRFDCDWSSDVCSSDLPPAYIAGRTFSLRTQEKLALDSLREQLAVAGYQSVTQVVATGEFCFRGGLIRSEERRVGKEWRSRWSPYH